MQGGRQKGGLSSFQALTTAIAAQVGTGNIIGACGAILLGGPGGHLLDVDHRLFRHGHHLRRGGVGAGDPPGGRDGSVSGGPVYYIKRAFPGGLARFLAGFFAVALILALGFMGCMVQSNSIGETCAAAFVCAVVGGGHRGGGAGGGGVSGRHPAHCRGHGEAGAGYGGACICWGDLWCWCAGSGTCRRRWG